MVAVYSDDYATGTVNMAGSLTLATYSSETVGGSTVAKYSDVLGIEITWLPRPWCRLRPTRLRSCTSISGARRPTRTRT